jgi:hypothetical protein
MTDQPKNPLLARLQLPGETFRLPSQGLFYADGELRDDVVDGEVHVFPMTAYDEILFKTPDMLLSGRAITEVFGRCIPQVINPNGLLSKDVDFLITALRVITYGPEITLTYTHTCDGAEQHEYKASLHSILQTAKAIDPTTIADIFTITLDNGQVVKMRPTTYSTILKLNQNLGRNDVDYSIEEIQTQVMQVLVDMIHSVDGYTDSDMIAEWAAKLPAGWVRRMSESVDKMADWGVEFKSNQLCRDCGAEIIMPFSANPVSFFS